MNSAACSQASSNRQGPSTAGESWPLATTSRKEGSLAPLVSIVRNGLQAYRVVRSAKALRLPPAFIQLNLAEWLINSESQGKLPGIREPILVNDSGVLISGFASWHAAVSAGQAEIDCIEFAVNDDEALQLVLTFHRPKPGWNAFTRTELALQEEPYFQSRALANQQAGGKLKALANLPKAEHIDVRQGIANLAGVCARNVDKVRAILKKGHPQLIEALHNGTVKINRALELCNLQKSEQIVALANFLRERSSSKTTSQFIDKLRSEFRNLSNCLAAVRSNKAWVRGSTSRQTRQNSDSRGEGSLERSQRRFGVKLTCDIAIR